MAQAIVELAIEPRRSRPGFDCRKMTDSSGAHRVRVGGWRIIYLIDDAVMVVEVTRVGPKPAVYR